MNLYAYENKMMFFCVYAIIIYAAFDNATDAAVYIQNIPNIPNIQASNVGVINTPAAATNTQITWLQYLKLLRSEIKDCIRFTGATTWKCFKISSIRIFDSILSANVIPIWYGVRLVRVENAAGDAASAAHIKTETNMLDTFERKDLQHLTLFDQLAMSLAKTLTTHMLQINLKELTEAYIRGVDNNKGRLETRKHLNLTDPIGTGRHRRHRYNMIITMMFGVTALGAVLVPMGFQMLSVVSGKALLLAKMALLLASINGLKRVANSGIHYGLYHVPGEHYGGPGYFDRGDFQQHHPRNGPSIAVAQPMLEEFGIRK